MTASNNVRERLALLPTPNRRRAIRVEAELALEDIAEAIGVSRSAVSRWERGLRRPSRKHRSAYAQLLDGLEEQLRRRHETA